MSTTYGIGGNTWQHGQSLHPGTFVWGRADGHRFLGPCPLCGERTFTYGGGWRCMADYCGNNPANPAPNVGPEPEWWNTGVNVYRDGNAWCAVGPGFVNLAESDAGFGDSPGDAVAALLAAKESKR